MRLPGVRLEWPCSWLTSESIDEEPASTMASFPDRKVSELRFKLQSLPDELKSWRDRSTANKALEKNHSQIRRLSLRVEGLNDKVLTEFKDLEEKGNLLLLADSLERKALAVNVVWDFFRAKLALREVATFAPYLALADAFTRECYVEPFRTLKKLPANELCPAPLVTFDNEISPWAKPQNVSKPDPQEGGFLTAEQFNQALKELPIALLGLPWSFLSYLPHMSLLAHEVGHAIERDCDLENALDLTATNMPLKDEVRRVAWQTWRKEVFADLYGTFMAGPAFVWSLADYLAKDSKSITSETRPRVNDNWTEYPTTSLRILLMCRFLERHNFMSDAAAIRRQWKQDYPEHSLPKFENDFDSVIDALSSAAHFDDLAMHAFPPPVPPAMTSPELRIAGLYGQDIELRDDEPQPARAYVAAARLLMDKLSVQPLEEVWKKLTLHHLRSRPPFVAGVVNAYHLEIDEDRERAAGAQVADILFRDL